VNELDCNEFVELVTAFLDGALDAGTQARVVDHLSVCDGCETYLAQVQRAIDTLGELPPDTLPEPARDALFDAFRKSV